MLLALLLAGCAHAPKPVHAPAWDDAKARLDTLEVAPVVFVANLPAPPLPPLSGGDAVSSLQEDDKGPPPTVLDPENPQHAAFLRNDYVGNVRFGGGVVRVGDVSLDARARLVELSQEEAWRAQAAKWLDGVLDTELGAPEVGAFSVPGPEREKFRGVHPDDGHDNVNLPRTTLEPAPLTEAQRAEAVAAGADGLVLVPMVRQYLTHNGGWFLGQQWGCMSGARLETLLVVYDVPTGQPVWWLATEATRRDGPASPSAAELDQALLTVEEETAEVLRKRLLR